MDYYKTSSILIGVHTNIYMFDTDVWLLLRTSLFLLVLDQLMVYVLL